ncbi:hypothetical protein [Mycolicibacterium bacteremicum]|uniref:hypothetical protein n=1 Tax=Mycolicibacterium bacteremicum TaxID=564198 RepID=UPI0026EDC3B7|nr:hypothetical protein [Mycolicibacterium bacteremicum]
MLVLVSGAAIDEVMEETDELASLALLSTVSLPPEQADRPSAATAANPANAIRLWVNLMRLNFLVGGWPVPTRLALHRLFGARADPDGSETEFV